VSTVTTDGYSPPPYSQQLGNALLESSDPQTGMATVIVQPAPSTGSTSLETIVTYTNYQAPPAQLKICKIAGSGVVPSTPFTFTAVNITNAGKGYTSAPSVTFTGGGCTTEPTATASISGGMVNVITVTSPGSGCTTGPSAAIGLPPVATGNIPATATATVVSVEAGLPTQEGSCRVLNGTFEVGTSGTITESVPAGDAIPAITINGISTPPGGCVFSTAGFPCSVIATLGAGVNEVSFTNTCVVANGRTCPALPLPVQDVFSGLGIVNYSLISQVPSTDTRSYMTYRADLVNTGTSIHTPLLARLTSLDSATLQVMGQGTLSFASAPAYEQVASTNTFTILADPTAPLDFSKFNWEYYTRKTARPRR